MNAEADQVGRSTMQNEGMINVQIARIDDALSRLARLGSASTSCTASNWTDSAKDIVHAEACKGNIESIWVDH